MTNANIVSGLADLSEAAYLDFSSIPSGSWAGTDLATQITRLSRNTWPKDRAEDFATNWRVVAHKPDTPTGFSATVFERINPQSGQSRYVFAVRGTAGGVDIVEDIANLVANGLAWRQVLDMYNWWHELTTPLGSTYQRAVTTRTSDALGVLPNVVVEVGQAWRIDRIATTQTQSPVLPASSVVDVTGHSLGGHLATAFSRLFTSNVAHVVTVNGAGYSVLGDASGNTNRVFTALGGQTSFLSARILNIYGDRGLEVVTQDAGLRQPGDHQLARIENNSIGNTLGHGSVQISTSLRLYDTLRRLEEGAGTGTSTQPPMSAQTMLARFSGHLRSGSSDQNRDFEALLFHRAEFHGGELLR